MSLHVVAMGFLLHPLGVCQHGSTYAACRGYNFWSGIGSDVGEVTLIIGLGVFLVRHNCHQHRCWRMSWHEGPDGHPVCKRHHPEHPSEGFSRNVLKWLRLRAPTPGNVRFHYRKPPARFPDA